ncbi:cupin domain-containing protein [Dactylosporangium sp. CA-092794]|uniref:cupin domain-containing protein n=1 Tax=Dactylosporangium sp. CA-092794 TaxID=3239929 RepID=UPI003D9458A1
MSEPTDKGIVILAPGEIEMPEPSSADFLSILADGSHTRGLASFIEYRIAPRGEGPPTHWHPGHDELFYVVKGELGMRAGDQRDVFGPRSYLFVPRGAIHTFWNPTDEETLFVSGWTPPGAEQTFIRYHNYLKQPGGITEEQWQELAAKSGTVLATD